MSTLKLKKTVFFLLFFLYFFFVVVAQLNFKQSNFVIWDMCVQCHVIRFLLVLWNLEDFVLVSPESQTIFSNTLSKKIFNFYDMITIKPILVPRSWNWDLSDFLGDFCYNIYSARYILQIFPIIFSYKLHDESSFWQTLSSLSSQDIRSIFIILRLYGL